MKALLFFLVSLISLQLFAAGRTTLDWAADLQKKDPASLTRGEKEALFVIKATKGKLFFGKTKSANMAARLSGLVDGTRTLSTKESREMHQFLGRVYRNKRANEILTKTGKFIFDPIKGTYIKVRDGSKKVAKKVIGGGKKVTRKVKDGAVGGFVAVKDGVKNAIESGKERRANRKAKRKARREGKLMLQKAEQANRIKIDGNVECVINDNHCVIKPGNRHECETADGLVYRLHGGPVNSVRDFLGKGSLEGRDTGIEEDDQRGGRK